MNEPKVIGIIAAIVLGVVLLWPTGNSKRVAEVYRKAEKLQQSGDYQKAIEAYNDALEQSQVWGVNTRIIDPDFESLVNYKVAVCHQRIAETNQSETDYELALERIRSTFPKVEIAERRSALIHLWAMVLKGQGKPEAAIQKFRELIYNSPESQFIPVALFAIGELFYDELDNHSEARKSFKELTEQFSNSKLAGDAQYRIAQSLFDQADYIQASEEFEALSADRFKNYPHRIEAIYKSCFSLKIAEKNSQAIERYTDFIAKFPESKFAVAAYLDLGSVYSTLQEFDAARINYQLALDRAENEEMHAEILHSIAKTHYDEANYSEAIYAYLKLIERHPKSQLAPEARLGMADSYFAMGKWDEALEAFTSFITEYPDRSEMISYATYQIGEANYRLAEELKSKSEPEKADQTLELALEAYRKVIDRFSDSEFFAHALYGVVWVLSDLRRETELEEIATEFIDKNRDNPKLNSMTAEVQLKFADVKFNYFNDYDRAAREYAKLWDYPGQPKFHRVKLIGKSREGHAYYESAKKTAADGSEVFDEELLKKSVNAYQLAISVFQGDSFLPGVQLEQYGDFTDRIPLLEECIMSSARANEKLERWNEARRLYKSVPENSINFDRSQLLTANSYVQEGKNSEAVAIYRSIAPTLGADNRSLAYIKLADLLRADQKFSEAAKAYKEVVSDNPSGDYADSAQYLAGLCYFKGGKLKNSIGEFQLLIETYKNSSNRIDAYHGVILALRELLGAGDKSQLAELLKYADLVRQEFSGEVDEATAQKLGYIALTVVAVVEGENGNVEELSHRLKLAFESPGMKRTDLVYLSKKRGNLFYENREYLDAINEYQNLLAIVSDLSADERSTTLYKIGLSHYKLGQNLTDQTAQNSAYQKSIEVLEGSVKTEVDGLRPKIENTIRDYYTLGVVKSSANDPAGAISAFLEVVARKDRINADSDEFGLIRSAHSQLANLYLAANDYSAAAKQYQETLALTANDQLKGQSHFAIARMQDEYLSEDLSALQNYAYAIALTNDRQLIAQAHYYSGIIYETITNEPKKALEQYEQLSEFSDLKDEDIRSMSSDALLRKSSLYAKSGNVDEAISDAIEAVKRSTDRERKIIAQYGLASLYFSQAEALKNRKTYVKIARKSAKAYGEIHAMAKPIENLPQALVGYLENSLFQGGNLHYAIGSKTSNINDFIASIENMKLFVKYVDQKIFPESQTLEDDLRTALELIANARFNVGGLVRPGDSRRWFRRSADAFGELAKRFPESNSVSSWLFQLGESYYAAQSYRNAIDTYRKIYKAFPRSKLAPESVYAIWTCCSILSEVEKSKGNDKNSAIWLNKMFDASELLLLKYPNSRYSAEALINLGNKYYNEGSSEELKVSEQNRLYSMAVDKYRAAMKVKGIAAKTKRNARTYLRETEMLLAYNIYADASELLDEALDMTMNRQKREVVEKAIEDFQRLQKKFPNTIYADVAYERIGVAYMMLADYEEKNYKNALKSFDRLWKKYEAKTPSSPEVKQALESAQAYIQEIGSYIDQ